MDNYLVLVAHLLVNEELPYVGALVARELQNLPELVISDNSSVALEGLLEGAEDLVQIEVVGQALHRRQALATAATIASERLGWLGRLTFSAAFARGSCPGRGRWSC